MDLRLLTPYKSFKEFPNISLPHFTVITGINGAGKSQFLEAVASGAIAIEGIAPHQANQKIRLLNTTHFTPNDTGPLSGSMLKQEIANSWSVFNSSRHACIETIFQSLSRYPSLMRLSIKELVALQLADLKALGFTEENLNNTFEHLQAAISAGAGNFEQHLGSVSFGGNNSFLSMLKRDIGIPLVACDEDLFYKNFPVNFQHPDLFQQSFSRLFSEYQSLKRDNAYHKYLNETNRASVTYFSDEDFELKYGRAPWLSVNDIFETLGLSFLIDCPHEFEDRPYEPTLTDRTTSASIKFSNLSSGERIIMSFALCLFNLRETHRASVLPEVFLFDEIDSPLHPSMTQALLKIVREYLVTKNNVKVILTTHSPSTVAMCPEESLYTMSKGTVSRLAHSSRDAALSVLLAGVPNLSILYENRRQVFVESQHDVEYYDRLFRRIQSKLNPEISLSFIAAGNKKGGGCAPVQNTVSALRDAGNTTVRGLIDWDRKNKASGGIVVIGELKRYSIESFILDPLLIGILAYQERIATRQDLGLSDFESHVDVGRFPNDRLQIIVNHVSALLAPFIPDYESDLVDCLYADGQRVQIRASLLTHQGHDYEKAIKSAFPGLCRFHKENELKLAMIERTIDDLPGLIPQCVIDAFKKLQEPSG